MTFTLLTTSDGKKMGKTAKGAVWLDENKTTPYEFYQYWRNINDEDVEKCMKLLTYLSLEQIEELCAHRDERINKAKEVLAYELTKEVHGEEKANIAQGQAKAAFGGGDAELLTKEVSGVATVVDVMVAAGVAKSKGEARRLIEQGGVSVDETKVSDPNMEIPSNEFVLHKGKKVHLKIVIK
jgi:tyrosyl-tRNA synthetase